MPNYGRSLWKLLKLFKSLTLKSSMPYRGSNLEIFSSFVFLYFVCLLGFVNLVFDSAEEEETESPQQHNTGSPSEAITVPEVPSSFLCVVILAWVHSDVNVIKYLSRKPQNKTSSQNINTLTWHKLIFWWGWSKLLLFVNYLQVSTTKLWKAIYWYPSYLTFLKWNVKLHDKRKIMQNSLSIIPITERLRWKKCSLYFSFHNALCSMPASVKIIHFCMYSFSKMNLPNPLGIYIGTQFRYRVDLRSS